MLPPSFLYFPTLEKENFLFQVQTIQLTCNSKVPSWSTADKQLLRTFSSFSLSPRRNLCQARVWGKTQIFSPPPLCEGKRFSFLKSASRRILRETVRVIKFLGGGRGMLLLYARRDSKDYMMGSKRGKRRILFLNSKRPF